MCKMSLLTVLSVAFVEKKLRGLLLRVLEILVRLRLSGGLVKILLPSDTVLITELNKFSFRLR